MRTIATLAATALLLTGCAKSSGTPPATAGRQADASTEQSLRALQTQVEALAAKLAAIEAQLDRIPPSGSGGGAAPPAGGDAGATLRATYDAAYNDYLKGQYELALRGFREYASTAPGSELTDNAQYWIGEIHYRQGKFRQAIEQFNVVLKHRPPSEKAAAALLKKGYSHLDLRERTQGIAQLRQVIRQYPQSDEAALARKRLHAIDVYD